MPQEAPRVKQEPGGAAADRGEGVCIKNEAESNDEAEGLEQEPELETRDWEPVCIKQELKEELSWDSTGLYADHDVKDELVLGPESLQRAGGTLMICGSTSEPFAEITRSERETIATHTDNNIVEITYMCDVCGKLFKQKKKLVRHVKMHLRENLGERIYSGENALFCKVCNKRFKQSGHLNRHERTHSGAKPHSCQICKKKFARVDTLRLHKLIHTGRKPYACTMCDKEFTQLSNLARHTRIHTGEKPYGCEVCSRRFVQSCDLKKHLRIHSGDKPYSCETCSKLFTCSGDLKTHKHTSGHKRKVRTQTRKCN